MKHIVFFTCAFFLLSGITMNLSFGSSPQNLPEPPQIQQQVEIPQPPQIQQRVEILPEITTSVKMSNVDINRIVCPFPIKDVIFSQEKGLTVKIHGRNAFVKFLIKRELGVDTLVTVPSELYIVCGDSIYSIIILPEPIPARTIHLVGQEIPRIRENISLFKGKSFESKVIEIIKQIYTENIPRSFTVRQEDQKHVEYGSHSVFLRNVIEMEGTGLIAKEYTVIAIADNVSLNEGDFLSPFYMDNIVAVSINKFNFAKGEKARVILIGKDNRESERRWR